MYRQFILINFPRLLTQIDKDADSPYYGSFDRNFWHYKIRDFSSAILQQGGLSLALMYKYSFNGNRYYNKEKIRDWAVASVDFWSRIQLKDGSFNEYYPNEHGFPPTAFGLYSAASICTELGIKPFQLLRSIEKAALYVINNPESEASNQQIAGITGVFLAARLLGDHKLYTSAENMLNKILKAFHQEGWFTEYGGFDLGYLSVTADQLVETYKITADNRIILVLEKVIEFVNNFVTPYSTVGGEYNSRNTEYYLPFHLEFLREKIPLAGIIADKINKNINNDLYFQKAFDDRYNCHYVLYSFIKAQLEYEKRGCRFHMPTINTDASQKRSTFFQEAGVWVGNNNGMHIVINLRKGGIIKVTDATGEIFNDWGYRISEKGGRISVTNWLNPNYIIRKDGNRFIIEGKFTLTEFQKVTPLRHVMLRLLALLFKQKLIRFLKNKMIFMNRESNRYIRREIEICDDGIAINDEITSPKIIRRIYSANKFSMRQVMSSKSFHEGDISSIEPVSKSNLKVFRCIRKFSFKEKEVITKII